MYCNGNKIYLGNIGPARMKNINNLHSATQEENFNFTGHNRTNISTK